ncbi:hypothetical protein K456DRAFT_1828223 [Colletotrichum gloeosporioides 23]|nr:hypothetical protein K456DRAFT_1828223 [Colletotrichum gloeosporioides 23]
MQRSFDDAFHCGDVEPRVLDEVCFGALYGGAALPDPTQKAFDERSRVECAGCEGFFLFDILKKGSYHTICWPGDSEIFAELDTQSHKQLQTIYDVHSVRFKAVAEEAAVSKRKRAIAASPKPIDVSINVYGLRSVADEVGTRLSASSIFLQHPKALPLEIEYNNPQFLEFSEDEADMKALVGITNDSPSAQRAKMSEEISNILDCLTEGADNDNIDYCQLKGLQSQLKPGVCFIAWREAQHEQVQSISRCSLPVRCGGIVADVMGLGKTLTVLASILQSTPDAEIFQKFDRPVSKYDTPTLRTKATLIVVSSAQLLENWRSEIESHFEPGTFDIVTFHSSSRVHKLSALASANIVLATYATIVAEEKGKNTLQKLSWFRIVLDEAHWIRNAASKQFKSVATLSARNRWCLTGTPVQNRLEDIAALAAFLQLQPFPTKASFQKAVLHPLSQGGKDFSKPLRSWLRAGCIRRTEKLLQLPGSIEETILVTLSTAERQLYDRVLYRTKRKIDDEVNKGKSIKKYNVMFTAILNMRMLCNSGTFSKVSSYQRHLGIDQARETECEKCSETNDKDTKLLLADFQFCPDCGRPLQLSSPGPSLGSCQDGNSPVPELSPAPDEGSNDYSAKLSAVIERIITSKPTSKQ